LRDKIIAFPESIILIDLNKFIFLTDEKY